MNYSVGYTSRAERDIADLLLWLFQRSPDGSARWLDALEAAQARISAAPLSFPLAEEADVFSEPVRQILFRTKRGNTYRALFVVRGTEVTVLCVRGPGQPPVSK